MKSFYLFLFSILVSYSSTSQLRTITGKVIDTKTKQPLSFCSVYALNSGNGVITEEDGSYSMTISDKTDSLAISMVGYKPVIRHVSKEKTQVVNFEVQASGGSLGEVSISARSKYSKAQRLVRLVIKNKSKHNVYENDNFQSRVYDKVELDVKNIPEKIQNSRLLKPLSFVMDHMDSTTDKQKFLPIYLSETIADFYYKKNPETERYDFSAIKSSGFDNQSILTYIDGLYKKINIYNNLIKLVDINFISPIADNALNLYNYYINDTMLIDGHQCIQVQFSQIQYGTNTFNGFMWVVDTTYAIKSMTMHMDKSASINFVNKFEITQNFELAAEEKFLPSKNILFIDINIPAMKKMGVIARKTTLFQNFSFNNSSIDTVFNKKLKDIASVAKIKTDPSYWSANRFEPLSNSENFVYTLMDTITKIPAVIKYTKIVDGLTSGYYTVGNIDIGNIWSFYTSNVVEGSRFNVGAKTNWHFNKNFQLRSYVGASTRDKQFRYFFGSILVLDRKQWSTLRLRYSNDIASGYDNDDEIDQNSLFAAFIRRIKHTTRLVNNKEADIFYNKFFANGFGVKLEARSSTLTPFFNMYYTHDNFTPYIITKPGVNSSYKSNEIAFTLRYVYKEKFITQHFRRGSLGSNYPIINLTYTKGFKIDNGLFKSDFNYNKWNMNIQHDFSDGRIGQLSYTLQAGITKGILPILLLDVQKGNDTYYYNAYAFNNMNRYEFVADKYASLLLQQNFGAFPFNHIPAIKKLKWRSLATFKGVIGDMTEANKFANGYYDTAIPYHFSIPNNIPYMEAGVGVENIFRLLRIDAIWRLNYLQNNNVPRFGILGSVQFKF